MRLKLLFIFSVSFCYFGTFAQLSAPAAEAVYGGRILNIAGYQAHPDTSRIFITTESANAVFYADVYSNTSSPVIGTFRVMPGLSSAFNYGLSISSIAAHQSSGKLFFIHTSGLLSSDIYTTAVNTVSAGGINALYIKDDYLFYLSGNNFYFGMLDASGNFTNGAGSPLITGITGGRSSIAINPLSGSLYILVEGTAPKLYKSSSAYSSFTGSTVFNDISPAALSASYNWSSLGIAPDARIFIGGGGAAKRIAYSDDESTWTEYSITSGGAGNGFAFSGDSASYYVYWASGYNNNNGLSGSWSEFGTPGGFETHPNDGSVFTDPINDNIVYLTTDQGIGASVNRGSTIFEINDGVEAVQVRDFDMTPDKNTAWLASKSGIRKVTNYLSTPIWTNAIFPNGDGSPYYSSEMVPGDTNTVYAGNVRVYKTTNSGVSWSQVFTPETAPFNFSSTGTSCTAIEVCDYDHNIVFAGFSIQDSDEGGLFYSTDGGTVWNQILLHASSTGNDADVEDIVFNLEGTDTVAYVGVSYDLSSPAGRSVYKLIKSGGLWTPSQDMNAGTTSTGTLIVATIKDIHVSSTGDTIFAAGTDAGINHPVAYYKALNTTGLWTPFTTSGFPFVAGKNASAVTLGIDTVYCAVDNEIYLLPIGGTSWIKGYSYPAGMMINFLYYDELLAGTGTGLYGHYGVSASYAGDADIKPTDHVLYQNYPNPFNPSTNIRFTLAKKSHVKLTIYNILGKEVTVLMNKELSTGEHSVSFNGANLSSGVYFYKIDAEGFTSTRKMIFIK